MDGFLSGIGALAPGLALFLASTLVFDVVHWTLHRLHASGISPLVAVGSLHAAHHRFLDRELRHHDDELQRNLRLHVIPEFGTQIAFSAACLLVLPLAVVAVAAALQVLVFATILRARGKDINHVEVDVLTAYRPLYFCLPPYHRLHHVHPDAYFSSWIKTFDHLAGTGAELAERRILMLGEGGDFAAELVRGLDARRGTPVARADSWACDDPALESADIYILCGDAARDETLRGRLEQMAEGRRFPIEVWAWAASEQPDPDVDRAGAHLWAHRRIIYRHIAPAPATGEDARRAARTALSYIRKGLNWVPTRTHPNALLAYYRFRRPAPAPA